ncbi:MAG: SBBP repeat-containing protein [Bryobacterales bacterium]|nr:SBBP repeat-containing protein [Bryobacterales bacterium]
MRNLTLFFAALVGSSCIAQPPGIIYSTTVPYSGTPDLFGFIPPPYVNLVVTDASGNSYVAGQIASSGLPTTPGVVQPGYAGGPYTCPNMNPCPDAFLAKFDSSGALVFLTYLGGTGSDVPQSLAVDAMGDIYLAGQTNSTDFPLAGTPWRPTLSNLGTFISKLSGNGKTLIWSTVLNRNLLQLANAPDGSLYYLAPTSVTANGGVNVTPALTKLTQDGQFVATVNVPYGTQALAVGSDGSVYIGGSTPDGSGVTPTPGAWQTTYNGGPDGFAGKMNASLSGFAWLTYVGGSGAGLDPVDSVSLIQPAPDGTLWVSGPILETGLATVAGALQTQLSPGTSLNGYLVRLSADGSTPLAATYVPAPPISMTLDGSGNVIISATGPSGFQATPGSEWPCPQPDPSGFNELDFFGKIDPAGQHLLWGTWSGPSVPSGPAAVGKNGNVIAAGHLPGQQEITLTAMTTVPGAPRLVESCIAQSAYPYLSGPLAPGEIFSIYGAGFGPALGVSAQPSADTIGTELGGVQVFIEDTPAPLLYVSSTQINLVAPYLLDGRTAAHITIVTADATSNEVVLGVRQAVPEIFTIPSVNPAIPATAAILNQDGTVNTQNRPAHVGDTVSMFVSGVGQTTPGGVDGQIPQAAGGTPVLPIAVQVGNSAIVTYAGNAPGLVSGAVQVNFQIPQFNPVGAGPPYSVAVDISAGGITSAASYPVVIWID